MLETYGNELEFVRQADTHLKLLFLNMYLILKSYSSSRSMISCKNVEVFEKDEIGHFNETSRVRLNNS